MNTLNEVQKFYGYLVVSELRGRGYDCVAKTVGVDDENEHGIETTEEITDRSKQVEIYKALSAVK